MDRDEKIFIFQEATPLNMIGMPTGDSNIIKIPLSKKSKSNYTSIYLRTTLSWLITEESLHIEEFSEEEYLELENSNLEFKSPTSLIKGSLADEVFNLFLSTKDDIRNLRVIDFSFESTHNSWNMEEISDYDMQSYYQDIEYIILNCYTLSNFKQWNTTHFKRFECSLLSANLLNSIETIKLVLYTYQNPIEFKDNYLRVNTDYLSNNFVYSLDVEGVVVYFNIYLSVDEVTCIAEVYWLCTERTNSDWDNRITLNSMHLERNLNFTLLRDIDITWGWEIEKLMIKDRYYTACNWPMSFKYYNDGSYEGIRSECKVDSKHIRRYLTTLMQYRLYYMSSNSFDEIYGRFWEGQNPRP